MGEPADYRQDAIETTDRMSSSLFSGVKGVFMRILHSECFNWPT